jgi:hypothetical protein
MSNFPPKFMPTEERKTITVMERADGDKDGRHWTRFDIKDGGGVKMSWFPLEWEVDRVNACLNKTVNVWKENKKLKFDPDPVLDSSTGAVVEQPAEYNFDESSTDMKECVKAAIKAWQDLKTELCAPFNGDEAEERAEAIDGLFPASEVGLWARTIYIDKRKRQP